MEAGAMNQTAEQLLEWLTGRMPLIGARLSATYAAIERARQKVARK
jgi:hypothetical protein